MRAVVLVLAIVTAALGLPACGGDGSSDEGSSNNDFEAEANRICAELTGGIVRAQLRVGANTDSAGTADAERSALPLRVAALSRLQRLDPPRSKRSLYSRYLALRRHQIELLRKEVSAFDAGEERAFSSFGSRAGAAAQAHVRIARRLGLQSCGLRLSAADARAAKRSVLDLEATSRSKSACGALLTRQYVEGYFPRSGYAGCRRHAVSLRGQPRFELRFEGTTGVDQVVAQVTYSAVGKRFAGHSETATLVYRDGRWKLFELVRGGGSS
jgi:hypothetical protein